MLIFTNNTISYKKFINMTILWQTACMVVNPIMVDNVASIFNCTTVSRASSYLFLPQSTLERLTTAYCCLWLGPSWSTCDFLSPCLQIAM